MALPVEALVSLAGAGAAGVWLTRRTHKTLPRRIRVKSVQMGPEGVFLLGKMTGWPWRRPTLAWRPWDGDAPHLLVAGSTGGGKSELISGQLALSAILWGWEVICIDAKGGADFQVAESWGATILHERKSQVKALEDAVAELYRRAEVMRTQSIRVRDDDGAEHWGFARSLRELPAALREEHEMKPRLVIVDETASVVYDKKGGEALRELTRLARSAGVHLVVSLQRPDADLLKGDVKHNLQARILLGTADSTAERMVLELTKEEQKSGAAVGGSGEPQITVTYRPPGRGLTRGVGFPGRAVFQAFHLDQARLLPPVASGSSDQRPPTTSAGSPAERPPPTEPAGGPSASVSGPSFVPIRVVSPLPLRGKGDPPLRFHPSSRAGASGPGLRARLRGPFARARLRLWAWRLLVGPCRSGPFARDPDLADACKSREGGCACRACGATVPVQADHRRPLWAGGRDRLKNMQSLCVRCHQSKSAGETTVRALRQRLGFGRRPHLPRWPLYVWVGVALFVFGLVNRGYVMPALILGGIFAWWQWRSRGRGVDGISTIDSRMEQSSYRGSFLGAVSKGHMASARTLATVRWGVIGSALVYLAGTWARGKTGL